MATSRLAVDELKTLVLLAQNGDRGAFGKLYENFWPTVYAISFRWLRNHSQAEDLCQCVFVQVMNKLTQLQNPSRFPGWIDKIIKRMALNHLQRHQRHISLEETVDLSLLSSEQSPLAALIKEEDAAAVRREAVKLGALHWKTVEDFYLRGLTIKQMARGGTSGRIPIGTVKRRLYTARRRLERRLSALAQQ